MEQIGLDYRPDSRLAAGAVEVESLHVFFVEHGRHHGGVGTSVQYSEQSRNYVFDKENVVVENHHRVYIGVGVGQFEPGVVALRITRIFGAQQQRGITSAQGIPSPCGRCFYNGSAISELPAEHVDERFSLLGARCVVDHHGFYPCRVVSPHRAQAVGRGRRVVIIEDNEGGRLHIPYCWSLTRFVEYRFPGHCLFCGKPYIAPPLCLQSASRLPGARKQTM